MNPAADNVIDQERAAGDAERLLGKANDIVGREMVHEEATTDEVERLVAEWEMQGVTGYDIVTISISICEMSGAAVQCGDIDAMTVAKTTRGLLDGEAVTGGYFKNGSVFQCRGMSPRRSRLREVEIPPNFRLIPRKSRRDVAISSGVPRSSSRSSC